MRKNKCFKLILLSFFRAFVLCLLIIIFHIIAGLSFVIIRPLFSDSVLKFIELIIRTIILVIPILNVFLNLFFHNKYILSKNKIFDTILFTIIDIGLTCLILLPFQTGDPYNTPIYVLSVIFLYIITLILLFLYEIVSNINIK